MLVNKLGDIALLIGCVLLQYLYKSVTVASVVASSLCALNCGISVEVAAEHILCNTDVLSTTVPLCMRIYDTGTVAYLLHVADVCNLVCVCLLLAAIGKSAQAGLHM